MKEKTTTKTISLRRLVILLSLILVTFSVAAFIVGPGLNYKDFPYERNSVMFYVIAFAGFVMPVFNAPVSLFFIAMRLIKQGVVLFPKGPVILPSGSFGFEDLKNMK